MSAPPRYTTAAIAIGTNLGDRWANMTSAVIHLAGLRLSRFVARSSVFETDAVGPGDQGRYLNAVAILQTRLSARELLDDLLRIEREMGRDRLTGERWGPRVIDLDLLLLGGAVLREPGLTLPHPRMHERRFVLEPLAEVAPDLVHPVQMVTVRDLLAAQPA